jgi:multidrug resistance efflux pump
MIEDGNGEVRRHLEKAEADLAEARGELAEAERDVDRAEAELREALEDAKPPEQFEVTVNYNGVVKRFEIRRNELVKTLLDQALAAFGPLPSPHTLSLFKGGDELQDGRTLDAAGVKPHDALLLRPSHVKGGE